MNCVQLLCLRSRCTEKEICAPWRGESGAPPKVRGDGCCDPGLPQYQEPSDEGLFLIRRYGVEHTRYLGDRLLSGDELLDL